MLIFSKKIFIIKKYFSIRVLSLIDSYIQFDQKLRGGEGTLDTHFIYYTISDVILRSQLIYYVIWRIESDNDVITTFVVEMFAHVIIARHLQMPVISVHFQFIRISLLALAEMELRIY